MSATTALSATTLPTPVSAPILESKPSPKPWEKLSTTYMASEPTIKKTEIETPVSTPQPMGHRRGQSESGSIMERGRPRKRSDIINREGSLLKHIDATRSKSAERRAFEQLPVGWKVNEVASAMSSSELAALQKQAFGQASRFEVLRKEDVDALSRVSYMFIQEGHYNLLT
jgi:hypothetical protein